MGHQYQQKQVKKQRSRYLERLITFKHGPKLLEMKVFPNAKEVTETFACRDAAQRVAGLDPGDRNVQVWVIGDGHQPRTGAVFALTSAWNVSSVDPMLCPRSIPRLTCYTAKVEDIPSPEPAEFALLVLPHSHAKIGDCLSKIKAKRRAVITMDCCVRNLLDVPPSQEYRDEDCWSKENLVRIWENV